jgi:flagella basal body P-ring formation protein FlgA
VVKAGSPATLLLDGDHVHIRLSVICLQNGITGQTIRATSKDHTVVYTAEVVDGGVLKGRL